MPAMIAARGGGSRERSPHLPALRAKASATGMRCPMPRAVIFDKAVPFADSLEQSHLPQISYVHILRVSAHMGMLEEPVLVNKFLAEFLSSVLTTATAIQH